MFSFQKTPLKGKLKLVMMFTSLISIILVCAGLFVYEYFAVRQALTNDLMTKAEIIGANCTAAIAFDNSSDANQTLLTLTSQPNIIAAAVFTKQGTLFASYVRTDLHPSLPQQVKADGYYFEQGRLELFQPIMANDARVGTIFLSSDLERLYARFRSFSQIVLLVLLGSLAVAYFSASALQNRISRPILELVETTKQISERRDYSLRAQKKTEDELGSLSDAFNTMLSQIQERDASLKQANESMAAEITERKRAEVELRESEARLQTIVENLTEGLAVSDLDGQLLHFNRAALDLHGFVSLDECRRHLAEFADTFELSAPDGTVWPVDQWPLARILRGEKLRDLEVCIRRIQADWQRVFSYGGTLVHDANGQPMMAVVTISDITERKLAEEEISKLNAELEQRVLDRTAQLEVANKELESFSYSVSHDLRAPLRSIDGFSQALLEDHANTLDEKGKDYLNRVRAASQRMAQLIDDLLNLSRVARAEMQSERVNLSEIARSMAAEYRKAHPGRQVDFQIEEGIVAHGDARLLRVVIDNLLGNAWKYTGKHPRARIEFGMMNSNGEHIYFVRDDGAGFDMAYADKLFGAFQRLHAMTEFPGTGIGLTTV
ncbi:MAG: PAS domain S-box protein [Ignavibacteriae bacterium]|nr:PAS domain S-box protein [Ignavibacteria bacterium]MBI3363347.1 PAS domain S-box protein [Ignavibacteriota bacterium]